MDTLFETLRQYLLLGFMLKAVEGEVHNFTICYGNTIIPHAMTKCPIGTAINITDAVFGRSITTGPNSCPAAAADCRQNLINYPITLKTIRDSCNGKILCDSFSITEKASIDCGGSPVIPDYAHVEYTCLLVTPETAKYGRSCVGDDIRDVMCPAEYNIHVIQALFVYTGSCVDNSLNPDQFQCIVDIKREVSYYDEIITACDEKTTCDGGVTATSTSCNSQATESVVIGYDCRPVTKTLQQCSGEPFTDPACPSGYGMMILDAAFVYIRLNSSLSPDECLSYNGSNECLVSIPMFYDIYYSTIVTRCQGMTSCTGLQAANVPSTLCFSNIDTTLVRISYKCLLVTTTQISETTTKTITVTTDSSVASTSAIITTGSTATSTSTIITTDGLVPETSTEPNVNSTDTTSTTLKPPTTTSGPTLSLIVGASVGSLLLLLVVLTVTCLLVQRKRKQKKRTASEPYGDTNYVRDMPYPRSVSSNSGVYNASSWYSGPATRSNPASYMPNSNMNPVSYMPNSTNAVSYMPNSYRNPASYMPNSNMYTASVRVF